MNLIQQVRESKATYAQIKEHILEKFDLNVSALYIAQVKQKCGLELEENYNKSKKDNLVVQECPKKIKMLLWMH